MEGFDNISEFSDVDEQVVPTRPIPPSLPNRLNRQTVSTIRGSDNNIGMRSDNNQIQHDPELEGLSVGQEESVNDEFSTQPTKPTPTSAQPGSINVRSRHGISIQAINAISGN